MSKTPATKRCFARRHMPAQIESFHGYALAVSRESGIFYSDARRDAEEFGVDKNTIHTWTRWLEKRDWMVRLDKGKRLKRNPVTGMFESIRYCVLSHDEWAARHPGQCREIGKLEKSDKSASIFPENAPANLYEKVRQEDSQRPDVADNPEVAGDQYERDGHLYEKPSSTCM